MKQGGLRPIPAGYLLTLGLAITALPFLGIGLGGILLGRAGQDPFDAWDTIGTTCFVGMFALGFAMRLIFWQRSSPVLVMAVRNLLTIVLALLAIATVYALIVAFGPGETPGWTLIFVVGAALALIPNMIWLVRYRRVE